jgi:hypothetical protein
LWKSIMNDYFEKEYIKAKSDQSDIYLHVPTLFEYASRVNHITEFGVRTGVSTRAFLYSIKLNNTILRCYDILFDESAGKLFEEAKNQGLDAQYIIDSTLNAVIEDTDLLFIDTNHTYEQVSSELNLHGHKVKKYIAFHDTKEFPDINRAIDEFCQKYNSWSIDYCTEENNGLTILVKK